MAESDPRRVEIRVASREDVPTLVAMLADDELGKSRETAGTPLLESYATAFAAIEEDVNNDILIAEVSGAVAGFLQLTIIPYLTYRGRPRALIEGVRVVSDSRGEGIGAQLVRYAIAMAERHGCHLVQLTTDKRRPDAIRFYEKFGFTASHEGMKLHLAD